MAPDAERVAVEQPLSLTIGLLWPRIHVSDGLAEALSPAELAVVLAHERAHARRRDGMRKLAAAALGRAHLPPVRRWLARELSLACEQACDAEAGRRVGDRLRVAETILATERLMAGQARGRSVCAFGGSAVAERVQALLHPPPPRASTGPALRWALAAALPAVVLGAADPLHHLVEHLLALILA